MLFSDQYLTIESATQGSFRDRGSKFIAIAVPLETEQQVKEQLDTIRKKYFDATHHCYAYMLGPDKSAHRMNDDGEPSGTAGRPILGQIQSADLTNLLIVVIRYYGGTKLGVSGLINAYKTAARDALNQAVVITRIVKEVYQVDFEYGSMNEVMKIVKDGAAEVLFSDFGMKCVIEIAIRRMDSPQVYGRLIKLSGLKINYLKTI